MFVPVRSGPPPPAERMRGYDCTRSRVVPVIDVGLAALALAVASYAALASDEEWSRMSPNSRSVAIPLGMAWTAVYGVPRSSVFVAPTVAGKP